MVGVDMTRLGEVSGAVGAVPPAHPFDGIFATVDEAPILLRVHTGHAEFPTATGRTAKWSSAMIETGHGREPKERE